MSRVGRGGLAIVLYVALALVVLISASVAGMGTYALLSDTETDDAGTISVVGMNNAGPTADAGGPYSVDEGDSTQLDGTGSTASQGTLDYNWQISSGNGTLTGETTATPTYDAPSNVNSDITVTIELEVTDGSGASDTDTAYITVRDVGAADAPSVDNMTVNKTGSMNRKFTVTADLSDPTGDGDELKNATIEFVRTQNGNVDDSFETSSISGDSATINYTSTQLGNNKEYEIIVTVYDSSGGDSGSASETRTTG